MLTTTWPTSSTDCRRWPPNVDRRTAARNVHRRVLPRDPERRRRRAPAGTPRMPPRLPTCTSAGCANAARRSSRCCRPISNAMVGSRNARSSCSSPTTCRSSSTAVRMVLDRYELGIHLLVHPMLHVAVTIAASSSTRRRRRSCRGLDADRARPVPARGRANARGRGPHCDRDVQRVVHDFAPDAATVAEVAGDDPLLHVVGRRELRVPRCRHLPASAVRTRRRCRQPARRVPIQAAGSRPDRPSAVRR